MKLWKPAVCLLLSGLLLSARPGGLRLQRGGGESRREL